MLKKLIQMRNELLKIDFKDHNKVKNFKEAILNFND